MLRIEPPAKARQLTRHGQIASAICFGLVCAFIIAASTAAAQSKAGSAGDQGAETLDSELRSPAEKQPAPDPAASEYSSATTEQPRR